MQFRKKTGTHIVFFHFSEKTFGGNKKSRIFASLLKRKRTGV